MGKTIIMAKEEHCRARLTLGQSNIPQQKDNIRGKKNFTEKNDAAEETKI